MGTAVGTTIATTSKLCADNAREALAGNEINA
jgi:hypothetical protein